MMLRATAILIVALSACTPAGQQPSSVPVPATIARTPIFEIQGEGHTSRLAGSEVIAAGVVTAVVRRERDAGFFIQDPRGDDNPRTSDAIFVDTSGNSTELPSPGDFVEVTGTVEERGRENHLSVTLLADPALRTIRRGDPLPTPVVLGNDGRPIPRGSVSSERMQIYAPELHAMDFWESLEGMRVEVREPVVTGPASSYGDLVVIGDGGGDGGPDAGRATVAGGVLLGENDLNLDRVVLDSRIAPSPAARVGDRFGAAVEGVVHYDFASYRVLPVEWPRLSQGAMTPEVTSLVASERALTVASYNVLNLSFVNPEQRFLGVARTIAVNLRSPDVIGLQEVQDDTGPNREPDGVVSAEQTMSRLADAIVAAGGARYAWSQIDPELDRDGGQPGGNIRVVWMVRPDRVTLVTRGSAGPLDPTTPTTIGGRLALTLSPGRIEPRHRCVNGSGGEGSRKPLAVELRFRDETIFLVNNHLSSKGGDDRIFGTIQPPRRGSEAQRLCQAQILHDFTRSMLAMDPRASIIVLGDMNEHEFRAPVKTLEDTPLVPLLLRIPSARRYTYNFEGNSQVLDHIFASRDLVDRTRPEIDIIHVNVDFPAREAASDHEPVIARFHF
ncbi:MAG: endonuclease/exonuclease/phosphatase family protein [Thermoanaerobaculia bacterium]